MQERTTKFVAYGLNFIRDILKKNTYGLIASVLIVVIVVFKWFEWGSEHNTWEPK